jgi:hypothetical protein
MNTPNIMNSYIQENISSESSGNTAHTPKRPLKARQQRHSFVDSHLEHNCNGFVCHFYQKIPVSLIIPNGARFFQFIGHDELHESEVTDSKRSHCDSR